MAERPRWDTDLVGHGVAGASDAAVDADRLAEVLWRPDWIAEDPETHLLPHIERVCSAPTSAVALLDWSLDDHGTLILRLEVRVPPSDRRAWRLAAYTVIAAVAETRLLVHEDRATQTLDVVTGVLDGDTEFAAHGHRMRVVLAAADSGEDARGS